MTYLFEVTNKSGRKIHLTKERWAHIRKKHPEVGEIELLEHTLKNPDKIVNYNFDETIHYHYKFFKHKESPKQYLLVAIKYLNGEGYVITAYFDKNIK